MKVLITCVLQLIFISYRQIFYIIFVVFFYDIDCTLSLSQCVCVCARGVCFDCVCFVVGCALQFGEIAHKRVHYCIITITITEAVTWIHSGVLCDCSYSSRSQCQYPATSQ